MERTKRILDRFPLFFKTWDTDSIIYGVVAALGKRLDEAEKDLDSVLRSHWVDLASGVDLDKLGALYNLRRKQGEADADLRSRLKRAIIEFKGGGTKSSILTSVRMTLGLPRDYPLEMVENPPVDMHREFSVNPGDTWTFSSESVYDADPTIEISLESEGERITNPTVSNLETGEEITFKDAIKKGETLLMGDGRALIGRRNLTKSLSTTRIPRLPRRLSKWSYNEPLSEEIGVFDTGVFDDSKFAIGIPTIRLGFSWTAYQPATFELRIPEEAVSKENSLSLAKEAVNSIKATGVRAIIKVVKE
jgi:hypothetical protein